MARLHTVIVVEDDASVRRAVARVLRAAGYAVQAFASAAALLEHGVPDSGCLVLDVAMPGMSGVELRKSLLRAGRDLPTIFITGRACDELDDDIDQVGALAVLQKPFNDASLLEVLARVAV